MPHRRLVTPRSIKCIHLPEADPCLQAVSPQVTISHQPDGRLPLHSSKVYFLNGENLVKIGPVDPEFFSLKDYFKKKLMQAEQRVEQTNENMVDRQPEDMVLSPTVSSGWVTGRTYSL